MSEKFHPKSPSWKLQASFCFFSKLVPWEAFKVISQNNLLQKDGKQNSNMSPSFGLILNSHIESDWNVLKKC